MLLQAANSGAITIGQSNTICKFSVSTTSYVLGIMPASGPSTPLATNFTLDYVSDVDASIHLHMVDLNGGLVKNITAKVDAGENVVQLDLSDLAEGVYWVSLAAEKAMQTERLAIFKDHNQANNTRACTALQCDIAGRFFYSIFMTGYAGGSRVVFFIFFPRPPTNRLYLLRFLI